MTSDEWALLSDTILEEAKRLTEKYEGINVMREHVLLLQSCAIIAGRMSLKPPNPQQEH